MDAMKEINKVISKTGKYKTEKAARDAYVNSWKQTPGWNTVFKVIKRGRKYCW